LVEAAGIEPASVNPPRTGDYMLSLSLIWPYVPRQTGLRPASPLKFSAAGHEHPITRAHV